uniref:Uncharacterized protein n=1 Tax=Siphoviridae sp. ctmYS12 TaxID=2825652 RepID=A0A8S5P826_9CAUD|nr:MAG TPA: hypothetical protein [Siphoviridae sp. ctmYS12]
MVCKPITNADPNRHNYDYKCHRHKYHSSHLNIKEKRASQN